MKKLLLILSMVIVLLTSSFSIATENSNQPVAVTESEAQEVEAALNHTENDTTTNITQKPEEKVTTPVKEEVQNTKEQQTEVQQTEVQQKETERPEEKKEVVNSEEKKLTSASQKIINNTTKKDQKIAEYMDKYGGNQTYAYTAYYLEIIQLYSIPVCIIGITIGAFNFYIIGEKKLDKREKGFSFIKAFLCGLVVFQVLPLIFALLVAGK